MIAFILFINLYAFNSFSKKRFHQKYSFIVFKLTAIFYQLLMNQLSWVKATTNKKNFKKLNLRMKKFQPLR